MNIIEVTTANFEEITKKGNVLLDFWAPWCGPCRMLSPVLEQLAKEDETITIGKINVDEQGELAEKFGVRSIPTLVVYKNGVKGKTSLGYQNIDALKELIK